MSHRTLLHSASLRFSLSLLELSATSDIDETPSFGVVQSDDLT